jgi:hypothetical protein
MNRRDDAAGNHRAAWDAIAWVVNGSATPAQQRLVEQHAQHCADCRSELQRQRELQAAVAAAPTPALEVEAGLGRLFERIDRAGAEAAAPAIRTQWAARSVGTGRLTHWLLAAVIVEAIGLSALGLGLLARSGAADDYQALAERGAAVPGATIRIVPAPSMRLDELQQTLHALNLQIVSGPNAAGAYGLAPQSQQPSRDLQLLKLRAVPGMRLVEPLNGEGKTR